MNKSVRKSIFKNFKKYAELADEINNDDSIPFTVELNKFSIEPLDDLQLHFGLNNSNFNDEDLDYSELPEDRGLVKRQAVELPESVDWRDTMSDPEHQDKCGSCWSFSAVSSIESAYFRATGLKKKFSYQELVDCVFEKKSYGNGCTGAPITTGLLFVMRSKHLASRCDYAYVGKDGLCRQTTTSNSLTNVALKRLYRVPQTDAALQQAVVQGVVSVGIKGGRSLLAYKSGIYYDPSLCRATSHPDHAVNLVGYGEEGGQKYWLIRNSWGTDWGEGGYYRMTRDHENHCKIHQSAVRLDLRCLDNKECQDQKAVIEELEGGL